MADVQEKIQQLQMYEYQIQQILNQKQQLNSKKIEANSVIEDLTKTDEAYELVGNILLKKSSLDIKKALEEKNEMFDIRLKSLEKQEKDVKEKAEQLQKEVLGELKEQSKNK